MLSRSIMSYSLQPHGLQPSRRLCPWGFPRQEHLSELPYPPPGDLPNQGMEPRSPGLQEDSLPAEPPGLPMLETVLAVKKVNFVFIASVHLCCPFGLLLFMVFNIYESMLFFGMPLITSFTLRCSF